MTLRPYQIVGRDFLASRRCALLADEMRVGKTPQAILASEKLGVKEVIVVCPAIAREHWRREWLKWGGVADPLVISFDQLRNDAHAILVDHYDLAIVDECHFAKNPEAQRTRLIYGKDGLGHHADRLWALSGTPAPKHAAELWPMLRAFGAVGMDYDAFVARYCTVEPFTKRATGTRVAVIPELRAILGKIMLRRTRAEVAPEMPAIGFEFLEVSYDRAVDLHVNTDDVTVLPASYDRENRVEVAMAKVKPLAEEISEAIKGETLKQTVVFGWHVEPLHQLHLELEDRGISTTVIDGGSSAPFRTRAQEKFREGSVKVIVANILAAGTAIDLSSASHGYFLELDWVPGNNVQAANRLISLQKTEPVTFDVATMPGTTDDRVQKVLLRRVAELSKLY